MLVKLPAIIGLSVEMSPIPPELPLKVDEASAFCIVRLPSARILMLPPVPAAPEDVVRSVPAPAAKLPEETELKLPAMRPPKARRSAALEKLMGPLVAASEMFPPLPEELLSVRGAAVEGIAGRDEYR